MMINYCFDCLLQVKVWKAVGQVSTRTDPYEYYHRRGRGDSRRLRTSRCGVGDGILGRATVGKAGIKLLDRQLPQDSVWAKRGGGGACVEPLLVK